uniref:Potassium channel domain-containing protein n=1 Tax=Amblyomma maculatum TaxID=34609 RepID=G3MN96_AMBMU
MRLARSNVRLLVLIAFYFLFIVIGASIFSAIEAPHENSVIRKLRAKRAAFLEEHPCVKGCTKCESAGETRGWSFELKMEWL